LLVLRTATREEGLYQRYLAFASLQLMTSFAVGRTVANVNPPAPAPQITGTDTYIRVFRDIGRIVSLLFLLGHPSPVGHQLMKRVQTGRPNLVSSKAKTVSFVFLAELRAAPGCPFARTKTPPQSDRFVCAMDTRSLALT
jgi:hypothetical protein